MTAETIEKISLDLKDRSYDIFIGNKAISKLQEFIKKNNYSKVFIVTDFNVANHHLEEIKKLLPEASTLIADAGEQTKSFAGLEDLCERLLEQGIDRKSLIIAAGGGVVGDLTGLAAAILMRGIDFVQVPTTLLSMVDSSVGGKTGVNCRSGKNLVGVFYQPKLVICDLDFLKSLPLRQIRSGYAEILKYGLIYDKRFYNFLSKNFTKILLLDEENLAHAIKRSCEIKAQIVAEDEKEHDIRAILNFGHTFAHVLEAETDYSNLLNHGEAVAIGMLMAAQMSCNQNMLQKKDVEEIKNHLNDCGFNLDLKSIKHSWKKSKLVKYLAKDKKSQNNQPRFILLKTIGNAVIKKFESTKEFEEVIQQFGAS